VINEVHEELEGEEADLRMVRSELFDEQLKRRVDVRWGELHLVLKPLQTKQI